MKFTIFKLHFTTPIHLGDNRDDYGISLKTIQSDTMYAAVVSCLAKMGATIPDNGDLGCTISSLFPFYQKDKANEAVYFFPKPLKQTLPTGEQMIENAKKIKKVSWLDIDYFQKTINGNTLFENVNDLNDIKKEYLSNKAIDDKFITSQVSPRVTVSRLGDDDAKPFYMDRVFFKDYSGLFFIINGDTGLFEKGMKLLQHEGVGTDRNVGNGFFEYETESIEMILPANTENVMSLSMFIPESKEQLQEMLKGNDVAYDFTRRGGWITTPPHNTIRKNVIHAFLPASTFSMAINEPCIKGCMVDLKPDVEFADIQHPIWRNGKSIFIPIKL